ncbi:S-adenosyl-L-methionine-dependent methyltransferase [Aspergillus avenaceus]|uniref:S-adenosyl-L-methionine-dependent methyltransferase n=1 Tax=Aspergillus avenaceus TaxID=36643 RepID=A0A5N6TJW8_ASPAV|nr:S-adenosyl-L-methionine-dependent methyltransferase [Aspergillus avenaceus]
MTKADFYHSIAGEYQTAYSDDPVILSFIDKALHYLPPHAHTLDMGCGTGNPLDIALAAAGHKVKGVDISPSMIEQVQTNVPNGTFVLQDMHSYQHPKTEPLDAVFNCRALFHHNRQRNEDCIRNWGRWLPRGGLLCMVVLTADDYNPAKIQEYDADGLFARVRRRFMGKDEIHMLPSRQGLKCLLKESGLEVVDEMEGLFVPPEWTDSDEAAQYCFIARKMSL